ncbi:MAG: glycogen synthase GlgA [Verrucomicrobia bacterium]|nr:glycogen synthase GlgA [Verrucomicrobiota bacterium]
MRILHGTSELFPYSKTGGLADMVDGLAKATAKLGHQVGVVTPLYRGIREQTPALQLLDSRLELSMGMLSVSARVWTHQPRPNLTIYFIDQPEFFDRASLYMHNGSDYLDNAARFIFLSKCVAHLARHLPWQPEVVHVHDWQTALAPLLVRHQRDHDGRATPPRTVLTIHNVAFQGVFPPQDFGLVNVPWSYFTVDGAEYYGRLSCLKAGIVFADAIITVSPRYAREIMQPELGCGLDGVLRRRADVLTGILNGVDYEEWKTTGNPRLPHAYSATRLLGKNLHKHALQKEYGLPPRSDVPLFGTVSRLTDQKGIDIELGALEEMLSAPMQFVLLGSGSSHFVQAFTDLARRHPDKMGVRFGFNEDLSHRIEAGLDFFVMPSRFEPCGLNQMYSLRYGTIPIVRATGGLDDSVTDITEDMGQANGIKFTEYSSRALAKAMRKALALYAQPPLLCHYRGNGMNADFSWDRTCLEYLRVYERKLA